MYNGKPPFTNFGEKNVNPVRGGIVYDSYMLSHNITPELYPNEPEKMQTYTGAIERAIINRGALDIGCHERMKTLSDASTRKNIQRRRLSLATLKKSRVQSPAVAAGEKGAISKNSQKATGPAEPTKEFFVPLSAR
jgi:hypothetical protein